ncbi:polymorphic toxin type 23 domain-containing protein [Flavobacterium hercynium]|uniref:Uncharacterized protein n=1 Tax=Flavobacterium hercynium TaxID=387094 RepID=A0A226GVR4_9FLAO|nr:polymorphic toxin type 23 domain-containing protein [Flavobacterium hercynium]OXA86005.1 hypothetical protein B0A66_18545 [Flavobacterium hercynium]SMP37266.1 toxin 23 [Flavobacterium hercynium]
MGNVAFGTPRFVVPKNEIKESEYKLESSYMHDHIKSVASEMVGKFNDDNTGIIYKLYKEIADGKVKNPSIVVSQGVHSNDYAFYDIQNEKIVVWEHHLKGIEKDNDKKIKLVAGLVTSYGKYINTLLKDTIKPDEHLETYDFDLFKFDGVGDAAVTIGKLESSSFNGNLSISFPKEDTKKEEKKHFRQDLKQKGGPNAGDSQGPGNGDGPGPGGPPINMGLKFSYSLKGGFTASLYAGIQKEVARAGDVHLMPSLNAALTYYGNNAPGTSPLSRNLLNATLTPAVTIGYKTGNALNMNLFTSFSGSGVNNPYEYAFTVGSTGVLSSGKVSKTYDENGNEISTKDAYNSQDNRNRNQIVGGASIKLGNFMISSYNDIFKAPLFLGMNSDQYWSAGVNMQAWITDIIHMAYAFDLYYGKSNNKNPFNRDKIINGQNYDYQRLFDILLNRGQETFSFTDGIGNINKSTKFGYGTFWPSNMMHDAIEFPEKHNKIVKENKPVRSAYKTEKEYQDALKEYKDNPSFISTVPKQPKQPIRKEYPDYKVFLEDSRQYKKDLEDYEKYKEVEPDLDITMNTNYGTTYFHHLFVVYNEESNRVQLERLNTVMDAQTSIKGTNLESFYKLDEYFKNLPQKIKL